MHVQKEIRNKDFKSDHAPKILTFSFVYIYIILYFFIKIKNYNFTLTIYKYNIAFEFYTVHNKQYKTV